MRVEKTTDPRPAHQQPTQKTPDEIRQDRLVQMLRENHEHIQAEPIRVTPPGMRRR